MSQYSIKVALRRGDKTVWKHLGIFFYNPASDTHSESVVVDFNSLPELDAECRAYPYRDGQAAASPSTSHFTLSAAKYVGDGEQPYFHKVGAVFHNPPTDGSPENWRIVLDSYPFTGKLRGYPQQALPSESEESSSEGDSTRRSSSNQAA